MTMRSITILMSVLTAAAPSACLAQGTSGAQFLGIGIGARAAGLGGAYVSLADDGTSLYWNPAGLAQVGGHRVSFSHVSWLSDAAYQFAAYALPVGDGAVGVGLEEGALSWDNTGEGVFEAGDFMGAVGYGRRLRPNLGVGGSAKFIASSLGENRASTYAFDLGLAYRPVEDVLVGAVVRNIGPGMAFEDESDPLPVTLAAGASYDWRDVTVALDFEKVNDLGLTTRLGVEYRPIEQLALRAGYAGESESALAALTAGVGFNWNDAWAVDYAYRSSDLGGVHQFGLSAAFGEGGGLVACATGGEGAAAPALPRPNLTVITELVREVVTEAIERMRLPEACEIHLSQVDQHDASWLVQSILLEELTARGHVVVMGSTSQAGSEESARPVYEISYRVVSCSTAYPRAWREWVIGSRKVERKTSVDIHFRLSDATGVIVWAGNVDQERREIIPGERLDELATPGQSFASPEMEPGGWDKVLEPVVVAGIVGGLIYLFYTSRSSD